MSLLFLLVCCLLPLFVESKSKKLKSCTEKYAFRSTERADTFLGSILNPITVNEFFENYFQKSPASAQRPDMPGYYGPMATFEDVEYAIENGFKNAQPNQRLVYGKDWKLAKRVFRDDDYWTGLYKGEGADLGVEEAMKAVSSGFTVIMNGVQSSMPNVFQSAWQLETALGWHVNVNLYISPPGGSQGFEAHLDWMDGFIFQITGKKRWKLYEPPLVSYPRPDLVYKPPISFLENESMASDLIMKAGDFAYIPRGVVHEAHTSRDDISGDRNDPYQQASMHLTFGLELAKDASVEMLLHHYISKLPTSAFSKLEKSFQILNSSSEDSVVFRSDNGMISFQCVPVFKDENTANKIQSQSTNKDFADDLSTCSSRDIIHLLISAVAGYVTANETAFLNDGAPLYQQDDKSISTNLLRQAVGVTTMTSKLKNLDPRRLLPEGLRVFRSALLKIGMKQLFHYLIEKGMLTVSSALDGENNIINASDGHNMKEFADSGEDNGSTMQGDCEVVSETLFPSKSRRSFTTLGSDFSSQYIESFFSHRFRNQGKGVLQIYSHLANSSRWEELVEQERVGNEDHHIRFYKNDAMEEFLYQDTWFRLSQAVSEFVLDYLLPKVEPDNDESLTESATYCEAWKSMMESMSSEKSLRKKSGLAALSNAGYEMNVK